jgi:TonB family protein
MNSLKHNNVVILSLLGVSLAVHAIVFFAIHHFNVNNAEISIIPPYQQSDSFSVAFAKTNTSLPNIESNKKIIPSTSPSKKQLAEKNNTKLNPDKKITNINLHKTSPNTSKNNKALLIRQVKSEISHHFDYPMFARRKGWQGIVLLEFNVSNVGIINNIEIKKSSGYEILDQAAEKSLSHVQRINVALNMDLPLNTRLQVPIVYQLTEG